MRQYLAATLAATFLFSVVALPVEPAFAVDKVDAKSEAQALVNDLLSVIEKLVVRAESASIGVGGLAINGSTRERDKLKAEIMSLGADLSKLDTKLRVLDLRLGSLEVSTSTKATAAKTTSKKAAAAKKATTTPVVGGPLRVTCEVSDRTIGPGEIVTYTAEVSGGATPYSYSWTGAFTGNSSSQQATLLDKGSYKEQLTVTDKDKKTATDECPRVDVDSRFASGAGDVAARTKNAKISILEPDSSARFTAGKVATVRWKTAGLATADRLDVFLSSAEGKIYYLVSTVEQGEDGVGSFVWPSAGTIGSGFVPYGAYTLRVCTTDEEVCGATKVTLAR